MVVVELQRREEIHRRPRPRLLPQLHLCSTESGSSIFLKCTSRKSATSVVNNKDKDKNNQQQHLIRRRHRMFESSTTSTPSSVPSLASFLPERKSHRVCASPSRPPRRYTCSTSRRAPSPCAKQPPAFPRRKRFAPSRRFPSRCCPTALCSPFPSCSSKFTAAFPLPPCSADPSTHARPARLLLLPVPLPRHRRHRRRPTKTTEETAPFSRPLSMPSCNCGTKSLAKRRTRSTCSRRRGATSSGSLFRTAFRYRFRKRRSSVQVRRSRSFRFQDGPAPCSKARRRQSAGVPVPKVSTPTSERRSTGFSETWLLKSSRFFRPPMVSSYSESVSPSRGCFPIRPTPSRTSRQLSSGARMSRTAPPSTMSERATVLSPSSTAASSKEG